MGNIAGRPCFSNSKRNLDIALSSPIRQLAPQPGALGAAVRRGNALISALAFPPQELLRNAGRNHRPGQDLVSRTDTIGIKAGSSRSPQKQPSRDPNCNNPARHPFWPPAPGRFQHAPNAAIAAGEHRLKKLVSESCHLYDTALALILSRSSCTRRSYSSLVICASH